MLLCCSSKNGLVCLKKKYSRVTCSSVDPWVDAYVWLLHCLPVGKRRRGLTERKQFTHCSQNLSSVLACQIDEHQTRGGERKEWVRKRSLSSALSPFLICCTLLLPFLTPPLEYLQAKDPAKCQTKKKLQLSVQRLSVSDLYSWRLFHRLLGLASQQAVALPRREGGVRLCLCVPGAETSHNYKLWIMCYCDCVFMNSDHLAATEVSANGAPNE